MSIVEILEEWKAKNDNFSKSYKLLQSTIVENESLYLIEINIIFNSSIVSVTTLFQTSYTKENSQYKTYNKNYDAQFLKQTLRSLEQQFEEKIKQFNKDLLTQINPLK